MFSHLKHVGDYMKSMSRIILVVFFLLSAIMGICIIYKMYSFQENVLTVSLGLSGAILCIDLCCSVYTLFCTRPYRTASLILCCTIILSLLLAAICPYIPSVGTALLVFCGKPWTILGEVCRIGALLFWLCYFTIVFRLINLLKHILNIHQSK